jgi:hypothetical protein
LQIAIPEIRKCGYNFAQNHAPAGIRGIDRYVFNIQKNPMVTVAEAAAALGIDARTVRDKLSSGDWKGEKRMIGMKEKWFMYRGELDRQLERLQIARTRDRVSTHGLDEVFDEESSDAQTVEAQTVEVESEKNQTEAVVGKALEEILTKLTEQFSKQLTIEKETILSLKLELEEKDRQLRLLPDLESQKAKLLQEIEAERKAAEIQFARAAEKEEMAKVLEAENTTLKEKAEEAALSAAKLEELEKMVQELQKPKPGFWQKLFGA